MKIIRIEPEKEKFKLVKFELIAESQEELDNLHNLFNYTPVVDALNIKCANEIRGALKSAGANPSTESWIKFSSSFK